jgi:hypothetical protein
MKAAKAAALAVLLLAGKAIGQVKDKEPEPAVIIEIGAAGEWAITHGTPSYGPSVAV